MSKKLVCDNNGVIYLAGVGKDGSMSASRTEMTDEALKVVATHLLSEAKKTKNGFVAYKWDAGILSWETSEEQWKKIQDEREQKIRELQELSSTPVDAEVVQEGTE